MHDPEIADLYARFSAHEFVLEVILANMFLEMGETRQEAFISDLRRVSEKAYGPLAHTQEAIAQLQQSVAAFHASLDNLLDKAARRAEAIRRDMGLEED